MDLIAYSSDLRSKLRARGLYRDLSQQSGIGYEWLCKFASGAIANPTIDSLDKLAKALVCKIGDVDCCDELLTLPAPAGNVQKEAA